MRLSYLPIALTLAAGLPARPALAQNLVPLLPPTAVIVRMVPVEVPPTRSVRIGDFPSRTSPYSIETLYLVNSKIILNGALASLNPQDIEKIDVYKEGNIPANWQLIPNAGVINLHLKRGVRVPSRSLTSLKRQAHLTGPVRFAMDGRTLPDASLRVATRTIERLEVRPAQPDGSPAELNILLTKSPLTNFLPGKKPRIMIRGTASR